jgi:hypothetical protein
LPVAATMGVGKPTVVVKPTVNGLELEIDARLH